MYGIQPKGNDDPFVTIPAKAGLGFAIAVSPGNFFIDIFPGLKYVPDWMPGTGWKQFAKYYREKTFEAKMRPYEYVQSQMVRSSRQTICRHGSFQLPLIIEARYCAYECFEEHDRESASSWRLETGSGREVCSRYMCSGLFCRIRHGEIY